MGSLLATASKASLPPPEERLCRKHGKPIMPSEWLNRRRTSGCSACTIERTRSPKAKKRRAKKWDKEDIRCTKHSDRRCVRSRYVNYGYRHCSWCVKHNADGSMRPSRKRIRVQSKNKLRYKRSMQQRLHGLGNGNNLRGLKLFERSTGFKLS